jgi:hypothetical protein
MTLLTLCARGGRGGVGGEVLISKCSYICGLIALRALNEQIRKEKTRLQLLGFPYLGKGGRAPPL